MNKNDPNARQAHARLKDFIKRFFALLVIIAAFASPGAFAQTTTDTAAELTDNKSKVEGVEKKSNCRARSETRVLTVSEATQNRRRKLLR